MKFAKGTLKDIYAIRFEPGEDVMEGLQKFCEDNGVGHGVVISGIGSLEGCSFSGMQLKYASDGGESVVCAGQVNTLGTENRIIAVGTRGELLYDSVAEMRVTGVYASPDPDDVVAYIRTPDAVIAVNEAGEDELHKPEVSDILTVLPASDSAIICGKSAAYTAFDD